MNNLDIQYQALLQDILDNGVVKADRTGTGTISVFGRQIRHNMSDGFPLLTTKKMAWKTMVTELLWFLRGDTNIKFLLDYNCHIWDGDAYKNYTKKVNDIIEGYRSGDIMGIQPHIEEMFSDSDKLVPLTQEEFVNKIKSDNAFADKWGDLGPIYGKQWRDLGGKFLTELSAEKGEDGYYKYVTSHVSGIDQIQDLINDLKTNPDSRRLIVNAWNVDELDQMILPPCHYGFQVYTSELNDLRRYNIWFNNNYETGMERYFDPNNLPDFDNPYYVPTPKRSISLMWNQRSVDTFLGLPFNIASYGLLLEIIAKEVNMIPDELIGNLGDVHLYSNHIDAAKEQIGRDLTLEERFKLAGNQYPPGGLPNQAIHIMNERGIPKRTREPYPLPKLSRLDEYWYLNDVSLVGDISFSEKIKKFRPDFFKVENYQSHPTIKATLSN
jgi:thymidylate synthase